MRYDDDLTALVSLLRRTRLRTPINQHHKDRLRKELFNTPQPLPISWRRIMLAASFLICIVAGIYYSMQPVRPIVGVALWHINNPSPANIRMNEWIETGRDSLAVRLFDQTELHLEPFTKLCIVSSTTERSTEDAVVYLKRGTLDACVPKHLAHALIVRTPDANVRVTGTKFRVEVKTE